MPALATVFPRQHRLPVTAPPERFGRYHLLSRLGRGGMAEVCLAVAAGPAGFRKLVVVKRLHDHLRDDPEMVAMFLDEARISARMNHHHVVQTYEVAEAQGCHYMALEYLAGVPLDRLLRACREHHTQLPSGVALRIVLDVLEGLEYAHGLDDFDGSPLDVVHRDVSPQNVFVTWDGVSKLIDFGIAQASTQEAVTRAGVVKGKAAYLAPEQAMGKTVDRRADIWSTGVLLWEALAGRSLFQSINEAATLREMLTADVPPISRVAQVDPRLDAILARALAREPEDRYPTARAMADELARVVADQDEPVGWASVARTLGVMLHGEREAQRTRIGDGLLARDVAGVDPELEDTLDEVPRKRRRVPLVAGSLVFATTLAFGLVLTTPSALDALHDRLAAAQLVPRRALRTPANAPATHHDLAAQPPRHEAAAPPESATTATLAAPPVRPSNAAIDAQIAAPPAEPTPSRPGAAHAARRHRDRERAAGEIAARGLPSAEDLGQDREPQPVEFGFLSLDTSPWAEVTLDGEPLGTTPLIGVRLPVGTHMLSLANPDQGITTEYRVTVRAGETTGRRIGLE